MSDDESPILQRIRDAGGIATGGPREPDWRQGWAVHPMHGGTTRVAHWFKRLPVKSADLRVSSRVFSLCGSVDSLEAEHIPGHPRSLGVHLLAPGNVGRCRKCAAKVLVRRVK